MLQNIRDRSTGWISKAIIGLIAVLLSFTGFEAIIRSASNSNNAAKVNGEEITLPELAQAKNLQNRRLTQQFGQDFDTSLFDDKLLTEMALKNLISRKLLLQGAQGSGFAASQASIDAFLLNAPEFQENGQFSAARYDQMLAQMGYGRLQFRQMLEQDMLLEQLQLGITASAFVTDKDVKAFAQLESQTRDFATLELQPDFGQISVTDEEVADFYQANLLSFMTPEKVAIEYVELSKNQLADRVEVSDEELQESYQQAVANLSEQRRAAHILFEVSAEQDELQALEKAKEAAQRLAQGESFAVLAKELSADIGSAEQGGDLGFAGLGIYESPFEEALFALSTDEVSEPVRTEYGWHLIKLTGVQAADALTFAEMKEGLLRDLRMDKVEQLFVELVQDLENLAYEAADLQQPAQELGLEIKHSSAFTREGGEGILANRSVIEAAFSPLVLEEGANSLLLELDDETIIVLRAKEHFKPEQIELAEVAASIKDVLTMQKAKEYTQEQGEALLADLRATKESVQQDWTSFEAVSRMHEDVEPQILQEVFRMPKPDKDTATYAGFSMQDGRYVIVRLTGVNTPDNALTAEELKSYKEVLASRQGQADFAAMTQQLEQEAKIERF